jgi:biotin carboxyl carrier protein
MRRYLVTVKGKELSVGLGEDGLVVLEGSDVAHEVRQISDREFSVKVGSEQVRVVAVPGDDGYDVIAGSLRGTVTVESNRQRLLRRYGRSTAAPAARLEIHAPMPAMVIKVDVHPGDAVSKGEPLIVLEAMKMENEIKAPVAARVKAIYAIAGKPVEKGELLLLLE